MVPQPPKDASVPGPLAYNPRRWSPLFFSDDEMTKHLVAEVGEASWAGYLRHAWITLWFGGQLLVAGLAGFTHAFLAWLLPFVAEEVGTEVAPLIEAKRAAGGRWPTGEQAYAYTPCRWVWCIDGLRHVRFSGGSYLNHGRFACWASAQYLLGALAALLHAMIPALLPYVAEEIAHELGTLIRRRRMLRNQQKDNTFVNPDKLSDYYSQEYTTKFTAAEAVSTDVGRPDGEAILDRTAIAAQLIAGEKPKFL